MIYYYQYFSLDTFISTYPSDNPLFTTFNSITVCAGLSHFALDSGMTKRTQTIRVTEKNRWGVTVSDFYGESLHSHPKLRGLVDNND